MTAHRLALPVATVLLIGTACGGARLDGAVVAKADVPATTAAPTPPTCSDAERDSEATRSYQPDGPLPPADALPAGSTMAAIQARGRLVVGVSADTNLFGARNALTGEIEGFDVDILREVATAIFGEADGRIEFRVMPYSGRLPALERPVAEGGVDIVAHTMTINCDRWLRIAFSSEYYRAGSRIMVKSDSDFTSIADVAAAGGRMCAPAGSTNLAEISKAEYIGAGLQVLVESDITDCLVAMQQGRADAATSDDTVLAGLAAQDPSTKVVGPTFTEEPYGLGFPSANTDFVRFVNALLEEMRADGRWATIYTRWLIDTGVFEAPPPPAPAAVYGREP